MKVIANLFLLGFSLLIAFAIGEVASRYVAPISPGPSIVDMDGNKQKISYVTDPQTGTQTEVRTPYTESVVINAATIQAVLGSQFRITGLDSPQEAAELALMLRAGALAAPMY